MLSPQKEGSQSEDNTTLNTDIEFSVMDNISSPKTPNSVNEESSSEEETNDSSSSEEDRYKLYV